MIRWVKFARTRLENKQPYPFCRANNSQVLLLSITYLERTRRQVCSRQFNRTEKIVQHPCQSVSLICPSSFIWLKTHHEEKFLFFLKMQRILQRNAILLLMILAFTRARKELSSKYNAFFSVKLELKNWAVAYEPWNRKDPGSITSEGKKMLQIVFNKILNIVSRKTTYCHLSD